MKKEISGGLPTDKNNNPTAIDLFCGCGGLTLGLKQAGFNVIGAVEIDSLAAETYRINHPQTKLWEKDIKKLKTNEVLVELNLEPEELDLLAGCPPCQGFSRLKTLNGARDIIDERNELIFDFLRFIRTLRPKAIMLENVPALAKDHRIDTVCRRLKRYGYKYEIRIINAADYGVPQRRQRMILLAGLKGIATFAKPDLNHRTVRAAISYLPPVGESGDFLHDIPEYRTDKVRDRIIKISKNGGGRQDLDEESQLQCHQKCNGFNDVYGRMKWDDVAPTITSGCINPSKGRFLHPQEDRAITLREAALLQSFPPDYYISLRKGKGNAAVMIGNALPPEMVRRHALKVREYLELRRMKNLK